MNLACASLFLVITLPTRLSAQAPTISYAGPHQYTAGTAITPLTPTSSGVDAVAYSSGSPVTIASGLNSPSGIAVDRWGNVFVTNENLAGVIKYPAGGGAPVTISVPGTGATGVTTDAAGDVYVNEVGNLAVVKLPAGGGAAVILKPSKLQPASGFGYKLYYNPVGVAVDAFGILYTVAAETDGVQQLPDISSIFVKVGSGLSNAHGIAVDAKRNIYVADYGNNAIKIFPADGSAVVTLGSGFNKPTGVAVDAAGNVYVADYGNNAVKEIPAGGGAVITLASGFSNPTGVAIASDGSIYVTDSGNFAVKMIQPVGGYYVSPALPAGLILNNSTGVITGTPTAASPVTVYTISAYNTFGSSTATVTIGVDMPALPVVSYAGPQTYTVGNSITPLAPAGSGVGPVSYSQILVPVPYTQPGPFFTMFTDGAGNFYQETATGDFSVTPPDGGAPRIISLGAYKNKAQNFGVDGAGNIYLGIFNYGVVVIPSNGAPPSTVTTDAHFKDLYDFVVDPAGNLYGESYSANYVVKVKAGSTTSIKASVPTKNYLQGIQVDDAGNVYSNEFTGKDVIEVKYPPGGGTPVIISKYGPNISFDGKGNIYRLSSSAIEKIPVNGDAPFTLGRFANPGNVIVSGNGRVYVYEPVNNHINEVIPTGGYYITPNLPDGLSLDEATGVISGTPTAVSPAKNYIIHSYNLSGETESVVNIKVSALPPPVISYSGPAVFGTGSAITPLVPVTSGVAAPGYSSTTTTIGSGFLAPRGVSLDAMGNIYVADHGHNQVKKIPVGGGAPYTIGAGIADPNSVAADAAGNVYVADNSNNTVKKIAAVDGSTINIGVGFAGPTGVAIDAAGSIYVADNLHSAIKQVPTGVNTPVILGSGFNKPYNVAVDAAGNLYISDSKNNALKKLPAGSNTPVTIGSGYNSPNGVAVDAFGNVFLTDFYNEQVKELPAGGGSLVTIGSGFSAPYGLATDAVGNIYVADQNNNAIKQIAPVGGYYVSPALPAGLSIDNTSGTIYGTPTVASAATDYKITAYNANGSSTAIVNITTTASVSLTSLALSSGILAPAFDGAVNSYTANVLNTTGGITITPTVAPAGAIVTINGVAVADGTPSGSIPLTVGPNNITAVVTSPGGASINTYTVKVNRAPSADDGLASLAISVGTLSPGFSTAITSYTANVSTTTTTINLTTVTTDPTATIKVNGVDVTSGLVSANIPIGIGNNPVVVTVTAQDGITKQNYVVTVIRAKNDNPFLATLKADGNSLRFRTSGPGYANYTTAVDPAKSTILVTPTAVDPNATITVNGVDVATGSASAPIALNPISTLITIVVAAQNGIVTKTYTLSVERTGSLNAFLKSVRLNPNSTLKATSGSGYFTTSFDYTAAVAPEVSSLTLTPTSLDPNATITVNGTFVTSGTASAPITLNTGPTVITIVVTSQTGTNNQTYTITVSRSGSSNASLANIKVISRSPTTNTRSLTRITGPGFENFKTTVSYFGPFVYIIPIVQDPNATVTVNGVAAISGKNSQEVDLNVGDNLITTVVTAPDGVTTKTYLITVRRLTVAGLAANDSEIAVVEEHTTKPAESDGIVVHPGFSPNGDGVNDYLLIDGLAAYPDNKLSIASRSGAPVYQTTGYNSTGNVFDGHAKNGRLQQAGTYFYKLEYKADGETRQKTGFIVIKY